MVMGEQPWGRGTEGNRPGASTSASQPLTAAALALAASGLPVFPCNSDKKPIIEGGFKNATKNPAAIREIFSRGGAELIGIPTGRASGRVVIDVDPRHNGNAWFSENQTRLPPTLTHGTPGGGVHLIFRDPPDVEIRNSAGRIAPGVDVRATGGYAVVPPSKGYSVKHNGPPADMPSWLIEACRKPEQPPPPRPRRPPLADDGTPYALAALTDECTAIHQAPFGQQEVTLNNAALKIGGLVSAGELAESYALTELITAGNAMPSESGREPWRPAQIEKKVKRAFADGKRTPRNVPPPIVADHQPQQQRNADDAAEPPCSNDTSEPPLAGYAPGNKQREWPDPQPLPDGLLPVAPFDFELVPDEMRPWVVDVCDRMQCPPEYVAVSAMAALGSLIGRKVAIRPKVHDDWTVVANMWAILIGRPGVLKSPAMNETLRPVRHLSTLAEAKFKKEMAEYEAMASVIKLRRDENVKEASRILRRDRKADVSSLLEEEQASPPTLKRYIANDTNVASLGVLLQQNPNGLLVFRDEILSLLDNLDREELVSERGFYLTGWNGDSPYTFDRIGRGLHLHIDAVCLSMLGSTQPGRIVQYLARAIRGGRGDDGLIQRFGLMVWPDVPREWTHVDRRPDHDAKTTAMRLFERLDALDWRAIGAKRDRDQSGDEEGLPYLRFGIDAYDLYTDWHTRLQRRLHSGELHVALESHLAKYAKLVPGVSLICHLADGLTWPVGVTAVRRAIAWATTLEMHAQRAYGSVTAASADTAKAILVKIRSGQLKAEFSSRDVWRPGWSRLTDRDAVHAGLSMLFDYDWLAQRSVETMGRPATVYTVNPKALGAA